MADDKTKEQTVPAVTPLEGKTTLDDKMAFEPERLAYVSTRAAAIKVALRVLEKLPQAQGNNPARTVAITGGPLMADLNNLSAMLVLINQIKKQYDTCAAIAKALAVPSVPPPPLDAEGDEGFESVKSIAKSVAKSIASAGFPPVASAATAVIGLLSFFRSDVEYKGATAKVDQLALRILIADKLKCRCTEVIIDELVRVDSSQAGGNASLLDALETLEQARDQAWTLLSPHLATLADAQAKLESASRAPNNMAGAQKAAETVSVIRKRIGVASDALERADAQFEHVRSELEKADDGGTMMLAKLLRAELIRDVNPYYLHVSVVSSGGHHRVTRTLWRTLFWGDGLSAMGGVVVRWALLEPTGSFMCGGVVDERASAEFPW
jgi:hypothetical protein